MDIRKAKMGELERIMEIYDGARSYMRENGNAEQWAGGYPSRTLIASDIENGFCHVCVDGDEIVGVFCYFFGDDPTYLHIYEGEWINDRPYGVLHRIAVAQHCKGVASLCFAYCLFLQV